MWQMLLKIKIKNPSTESGFTMLEVLVSILIAVTFILGTLQAMVVNAALQVKAQRQALANFWIQEDLEYVKSVAAALKPSNPAYPIANGDLSLKCSALTFGTAGTNASYADTLRYLIHPGSPDTIAKDIVYPVDKTIAQTNPVVLTGMTPTSTTTESRSQIVDTKTKTNPLRPQEKGSNSARSYRLVRQISIDTASNPTNARVLKINYLVFEVPKKNDGTDDETAVTPTPSTDQTKILARLYAEVIPAGVFECP